jgi:hypothetical protein
MSDKNTNSDFKKFATTELSWWHQLVKAWRIDRLDHDPHSFKFSDNFGKSIGP